MTRASCWRRCVIGASEKVAKHRKPRITLVASNSENKEQQYAT